MTKCDFLEELERQLDGLPREDIDNSIEYYGEMIDEKIEEGLSEEDAVAEIGSPSEIADGILRETPLKKLVKERVKPKRQLTALEIVLIVVGAPLWLPIIIAILAVLFSVLISLWAAVISLWTVPLALGVCAVAVFLLTIVNLIACQFGLVFFELGTGLLLAGLAILWGVACLYISKGLVWLCKTVFLLIKKCFVGKGRTK